ncbi:MAG: hypothetical protein JRF63_12755 [Deltaproteobacteria bacterium]|nr:hypothetical protein [Deltaproteobacteria bacterium]
MNSVFYDNEDVGLHNRQGGFAEVSNSIFRGHPGGSITSDNESGANVEYSVVQGGYPGEGNIDANPSFKSPGDGNFKLNGTSPCIDAANGDEAPEHDANGKPRVDDPDTQNTGIGPPWADIGAHEYQS